MTYRDYFVPVDPPPPAVPAPLEPGDPAPLGEAPELPLG
jgi:hypothetical protein